ncbi:hypothetical protein ACHAWT_003067, partial [Skeletonema menzelii]
FCTPRRLTSQVGHKITLTASQVKVIEHNIPSNTITNSEQHHLQPQSIIMNNSSSSHSSKSKDLSGDDSLRIASSSVSAPPLVESLVCKVSYASAYSSPSTGLYKVKDTANTNANSTNMKGSDMDMQTLRIPTKSENCKPGPTPNQASCASGLALVGFGGDVEISDQSLTALVERINLDQGNTSRQNSTLQNEGWGDLHSPQVNMFLRNGNEDN